MSGTDAALEFYSDGYVAVVLANMDTVGPHPILQRTRSLFHDPRAASTADASVSSSVASS